MKLVYMNTATVTMESGLRSTSTQATAAKEIPGVLVFAHGYISRQVILVQGLVGRLIYFLPDVCGKKLCLLICMEFIFLRWAELPIAES